MKTATAAATAETAAEKSTADLAAHAAAAVSALIRPRLTSSCALNFVSAQVTESF